VALKKYQQRVVDEVKQYLELLAAKQRAGVRNAALEAWQDFAELVRQRGGYLSRQTGLGKDLPTVCLKVPTGGGKTLLAAHILGIIYQTLLPDRNGAASSSGSSPATKYTRTRSRRSATAGTSTASRSNTASPAWSRSGRSRTSTALRRGN
jgi:hypothetical protein